MLFLGIESSCDETAAAVFTEEPTVLSSVVASQTNLHARFGGVVPELAARAHLERLLPVIDEALGRAGIGFSDLGCIAVHYCPGLVGALLVGVSCAKSLALALELPLVAVNHVEAHVYACRIAANRDIFPCVGFVVSGGHTCLFHCRSALEFELVGSTIDDAAGEAFDKVASILGLGFPGGPAVERAAASGDPKAHRFPRSFWRESRLDFSFSGLKTAVLYAARGQDARSLEIEMTSEQRSNLAASFQQAVIDVLVDKARQALESIGCSRLAVGGGVAANSAFRASLATMAQLQGVELIIPPLALCTDNAAMAAMAVEKWRVGDFSGLDLDAAPGYQPTKAWKAK